MTRMGVAALGRMGTTATTTAAMAPIRFRIGLLAPLVAPGPAACQTRVPYTRAETMTSPLRSLRPAIIVVATLGPIAMMPSLPRAQAPASAGPPGQTLFAARCGFCHGRDAAGGGGRTGPPRPPPGGGCGGRGKHHPLSRG